MTVPAAPRWHPSGFPANIGARSLAKLPNWISELKGAGNSPNRLLSRNRWFGDLKFAVMPLRR
jgi:hypothetical protein